MSILLVALAVAAFTLIVVAVFYFVFMSSTPNLRLPVKKITVGSAQFQAEIANSTTTRARGLSGRDSLGKNEGMLFIFDSPRSYGFWMKDMNFPLDFVWINGDKVVGVTENVPPPAPGTSMFNLKIYSPPEYVDKILEISSGEVKKNNLQVGQVVILAE